MLEGIIFLLLISNFALALCLVILLKVYRLEPVPTTPLRRSNLEWIREKTVKRRKPIVVSDETEWKKEQDNRSRA